MTSSRNRFMFLSYSSSLGIKSADSKARLSWHEHTPFGELSSISDMDSHLGRLSNRKPSMYLAEFNSFLWAPIWGLVFDVPDSLRSSDLRSSHIVWWLLESSSLGWRTSWFTWCFGMPPGLTSMLDWLLLAVLLSLKWEERNLSYVWHSDLAAWLAACIMTIAC